MTQRILWIALLTLTATFAATVPTSTAVGTCTFLDPQCPALACIGTWGGGSGTYHCQYMVPGRLPVLGAISNCGGVAPLKNGCSGGGVLDDQWRVEIRAAGTFAGTVTADLATATGSLVVTCELPKTTSPGNCTQTQTGTLADGQSFTLAGSVAPLDGAPAPAGHWLISVYTGA